MLVWFAHRAFAVLTPTQVIDRRTGPLPRPYGTKASKMLYDRLIAEFLSADRRPMLLDESNGGITVVEVLAAFWKHCKSYYVKNGERTNEVDAFKLFAISGACTEITPLRSSGQKR